MSKKANHNSIIFLTTLSVYLGLVLVGGAAPVLAHSALTRGFDIKNEIIFEDDLDKKPDEDCDDCREIDIATVLVDFVRDLQNLRRNELYDFEQENNFYVTRKRFVYADNSLGLEVYEKDAFSALDKAFVKVLEKLDNNNLRNLADFTQNSSDKEPFKKISLELYSTLELKAKLFISFQKTSSERASLLAENLNSVFLLKANNAEEMLAKEIYENTKATSENNQVFIVTRLPRGSLNTLLAEKEAQ